MIDNFILNVCVCLEVLLKFQELYEICGNVISLEELTFLFFMKLTSALDPQVTNGLSLIVGPQVMALSSAFFMVHM